MKAMKAGKGGYALLFVAVLALLFGVGQANAANILYVADNGTAGAANLSIATVLQGDGHTVTQVIGDYSGGNNPTLLGSLSSYGAVYWAASGDGEGSTHDPGVFTNLTNYVTGGGKVFVTGYDSIASPFDFFLIGFLGGTGVLDTGDNPGAIINVANSLTTGVVDIQGVTPTGAFSDRDARTGLGAGTVGVSAGPTSGFQWTLRTLSLGEIAYVSNGAASFATETPSWTNTSAGGAGAYNAALRNFAASAGAGAPVPEPSTLLLFGTGLVGLAAYGRRKRRA